MAILSRYHISVNEFLYKITQYFAKAHVTHNLFAPNIAIKRSIKIFFFLQNIVVTIQNFIKLHYDFLYKLYYPLTAKIFLIHTGKKILDEKYLFIAISFILLLQYCVQNSESHVQC